MAALGDIYVVTGYGHGHLRPCMELCKQLCVRDYRAVLVVPSTVSSTIAPFVAQNPLVAIAEITPTAFFTKSPDQDPQAEKAMQDLHGYLLQASSKPLCAIVDFHMSWMKSAFWKHDVPVVSFLPFSACAAAMEWGAWNVRAVEIGSPGEARPIPGLPLEMSVTYWDLKRKPFAPLGLAGKFAPGNRPIWLPAIEGSVALLINSCDDLEASYMKYIEQQGKIPVWGVGPLLPDFYRTSNADTESTARSGLPFTEETVLKWLDSKSPGSVLYVAFGSMVKLDEEEHDELASALKESGKEFLWVVGGAEEKCHIQGRGMVIQGWAPQQKILSHKATGAFLSHCGWNSVIEGLSQGLPFLAWPVRGDQPWNAKLLVESLGVGCKVADDMSKVIRKADILKGIERVTGDDELRRKATGMKQLFAAGFPSSSDVALNAFIDFVKEKQLNT